MLSDLIIELLEATDPKEKEKVYRKLEKVGVDRMTADYISSQYYPKKGREEAT